MPRQQPSSLHRNPAAQRRLRVGEQIRHVISDMFTRGSIHDPALSGRTITVSEVRMSADLSHATCFVMPLGGEMIADVMQGLERARPYIRGQVARRLKLRSAPQLAFRVDDGFEHAQRISELLKDGESQG